MNELVIAGITEARHALGGADGRPGRSESIEDLRFTPLATRAGAMANREPTRIVCHRLGELALAPVQGLLSIVDTAAGAIGKPGN